MSKNSNRRKGRSSLFKHFGSKQSAFLLCLKAPKGLERSGRLSNSASWRRGVAQKHKVQEYDFQGYQFRGYHGDHRRTAFVTGSDIQLVWKFLKRQTFVVKSSTSQGKPMGLQESSKETLEKQRNIQINLSYVSFSVSSLVCVPWVFIGLPRFFCLLNCAESASLYQRFSSVLSVILKSMVLESIGGFGSWSVGFLQLYILSKNIENLRFAQQAQKTENVRKQNK